MYCSVRVLLSTALAAALVAGPVIAKMTPGAPAKARLAKIRRLYADQRCCDVEPSSLSLHEAAEVPLAADSPAAALFETRTAPNHRPGLIVRCFKAVLAGATRFTRRTLESLPGEQFSPGFSPIRC
jgi:hypothetical protein